MKFVIIIIFFFFEVFQWKLNKWNECIQRKTWMLVDQLLRNVARRPETETVGIGLQCSRCVPGWIVLSRSNNSSHGAQGLGTILRRGFAVTRLQLRINVIANSHCAYQRPCSIEYQRSYEANDVSAMKSNVVFNSYRLNNFLKNDNRINRVIITFYSNRKWIFTSSLFFFFFSLPFLLPHLLLFYPFS